MHAHTLSAAAGVEVTLWEHVIYPLLPWHVWATRIEGFCIPTYKCGLSFSFMCVNIDQSLFLGSFKRKPVVVKAHLVIKPEKCMMVVYSKSGHWAGMGTDHKEGHQGLEA